MKISQQSKLHYEKVLGGGPNMLKKSLRSINFDDDTELNNSTELSENNCEMENT